MSIKSSESRHVSSLLLERKVSGTAMAAVLSLALVFGLFGFVFNTLWIVSIVLLALGLGYVVANARQDRREVTDQRLENAASSREVPDIAVRSLVSSSRRRRIR
jgi:uncharacterized membrane protein